MKSTVEIKEKKIQEYQQNQTSWEADKEEHIPLSIPSYLSFIFSSILCYDQIP
jgi:hypothetical protein